MAYSYIVLPWKRVEPVFNRLFTYTLFGALEANLVAYRVPADVLRLVDGTVTYRVQQKYLSVFRFDSLGPFIDLMSFGVIRFVNVDPTLTTKPMKTRKDWIPIGNG